MSDAVPHSKPAWWHGAYCPLTGQREVFGLQLVMTPNHRVMTVANQDVWAYLARVAVRM